jgi:NADPH:quinone reductase-like Zn-dependent oxidoreductase
MQAVIYNEYGAPDVLHMETVETPTPKADEVLIRIHATSIGFGDLMARNMGNVTPRSFNMPAPLWFITKIVLGWRKPKNRILGAEIVGVVEAIGDDVTNFKVGDEVFAYPGQGFGGYAEYRTMPADGMVAHKPANISFEEAATIPYGAMTAMNLLKKANIQAGQKVLINGASGSIGSYAVQLAKHYGAEVTGVCGAPRMAMVRELGADHVIDYKQEDFTQDDVQYDVILDVLGRLPFSKARKALTPNGRMIKASFKMGALLRNIWTARFGTQKLICSLSMENQAQLEQVKDLVEAGTIKTVLDRSFPLAQATEAHRYIESGAKTGNVVLVVGNR